MPQPAICAHFDQPLDVERHFLAQVAFDGTLGFKDLATPARWHSEFDRVRPMP